jgi:hypothetical protein
MMDKKWTLTTTSTIWQMNCILILYILFIVASRINGIFVWDFLGIGFN